MTSDVANSRLALIGLRLFYALLVVFLYAPILLLAIFSFNDNPTPAFPLDGLTLRWYQQFLSNQQLIGALRNSMVVATISSVCSRWVARFRASVWPRARALRRLSR